MNTRLNEKEAVITDFLFHI